MSSMVTSEFTIGPMPTMHTLLSVILVRSAESFTFDSANTSELPICTAPCVICVMPWPEPPPWTVICTPGFSCMNCSAAASHSGCSAVEPTAVMVPASAFFSAEAPDVPADVVSVELLELPQPVRPKPATANADMPAMPMKRRRLI